MNADIKKPREPQIDILRGVAIVTMIAANMAPYLLQKPHPIYLRLYGTFAAPLFILLSGMMVTRGYTLKNYGFSNYLHQGLVILFIAAILDMVLYGSVPFLTVDVLYLIGLSTILLYPILRLSVKIKVIISVIIYIVTPVLQWLMKYPQDYYYVTIKGNPASLLNHSFDIFSNWISTATFPIFPWFGYVVLGSALGSLRWKVRDPRLYIGSNSIITSVILLISGSILFYLFPGPLYVRSDYSEMFYPATLGFFLTSIGVITFLFHVTDRFYNSPLLSWLRPFGESSMFIYVTHGMIIQFILAYIFGLRSFSYYFIIYLYLLVFMYATTFVLIKNRPHLKTAPLFVRIFFGA